MYIYTFQKTLCLLGIYCNTTGQISPRELLQSDGKFKRTRKITTKKSNFSDRDRQERRGMKWPVSVKQVESKIYYNIYIKHIIRTLCTVTRVSSRVFFSPPPSRTECGERPRRNGAPRR